MVVDRVTDGRRIAELLASELDGRSDAGLDRVTATNPNPDADPTVEGTRAYDVAVDGSRVARVFVQPDRARMEIEAGGEAAVAAARDGGLRVRPAGEPPGVLVFVESGAQVKRAVPVVAAVVDVLAE